MAFTLTNIVCAIVRLLAPAAAIFATGNSLGVSESRPLSVRWRS